MPTGGTSLRPAKAGKGKCKLKGKTEKYINYGNL